MDEQKPFQVEVTIQAPPDRVWAALTDPREIRRWHGWDAEGLDAEIEYIYVEHATRVPPDRIGLDDLGDGQVIELRREGSATVVRVSRPGSRPGDGEGDGAYDSIEEGWRSFFEQMRHYLERHPDEERRTIFLEGKAVASAMASALAEQLPGLPSFESTFQRGIATEELGGGLVVLSSQEMLDSSRAGAVHITVTTHGLDDESFARIHDEWWSWWTSRVEAPVVTVSP